MKGQRIEIFKNLKNIFLINNQHSLKSYQLGNIENFSKEVFFRLTKLFFRNKIFFVHVTTFVQFFKYCKAKIWLVCFWIGQSHQQLLIISYLYYCINVPSLWMCNLRFHVLFCFDIRTGVHHYITIFLFCGYNF